MASVALAVCRPSEGPAYRNRCLNYGEAEADAQDCSGPRLLTRSSVSTNSAGPSGTECGAGYVSGVSGSVRVTKGNAGERRSTRRLIATQRAPGAIALRSARQPIGSVISTLPQLQDAAETVPMLK